ncbi:MAG: hypothetical protein DRP01_01545 [Archaeoglobales archaeon]|nr:MAG: hypothetical protein DRP01_01545 [Archaeoglobales archaeon]
MKAEIYLGKYLRENCLGASMDLNQSKLFVVYPYIGYSTDEKVVEKGEDYIILRIKSIDSVEPDKIVLGIEDDNFWPVIIRLNQDEVKKLIKALNDCLKALEKGIEKLEGQIYVRIGDSGGNKV